MTVAVKVHEGEAGPSLDKQPAWMDNQRSVETGGGGEDKKRCFPACVLLYRTGHLVRRNKTFILRKANRHLQDYKKEVHLLLSQEARYYSKKGRLVFTVVQ